jgi:hypothetical protein
MHAKCQETQLLRMLGSPTFLNTICGFCARMQASVCRLDSQYIPDTLARADQFVRDHRTGDDRRTGEDGREPAPAL